MLLRDLNQKDKMEQTEEQFILHSSVIWYLSIIHFDFNILFRFVFPPSPRDALKALRNSLNKNTYLGENKKTETYV